jgi:predicted LPLAT superfamily acyltransferase
MAQLTTATRFPDPDLAYRALIEAHRGLSDEESAALNTRLALVLANHIGDLEVLREALALAKGADCGRTFQNIVAGVHSDDQDRDQGRIE